HSYYLHVFSITDTATTYIYTLSLHDALPIFLRVAVDDVEHDRRARLRIADDLAERVVRLDLGAVDRGDDIALDEAGLRGGTVRLDRKSTRLNSSHVKISYAVFCLKKKKQNTE